MAANSAPRTVPAARAPRRRRRRPRRRRRRRRARRTVDPDATRLTHSDMIRTFSSVLRQKPAAAKNKKAKLKFSPWFSRHARRRKEYLGKRDSSFGNLCADCLSDVGALSHRAQQDLLASPCFGHWQCGDVERFSLVSSARRRRCKPHCFGLL